ncbi:MAG: LbetaH domain-containing protein [Planctomycetota bacterium]|jgi:putative colanic acid biosynthesis acetyltransferase WcaF
MVDLGKLKKINLSKTSTPCSFKVNALRCLWHFIQLTLFRFSPRFFYCWRRILLRTFGAKIGKKVRIYPSVSIVMPWKLSVSDNSVIGPNVICNNMGGISIGKDVVVSQYSHLCSSSHDYTSSTFKLTFAPIQVCDYSWICADAFVVQGITIGKGAVVGARSVVVCDVEDWTIVAGNPAKYIKNREILS